MLKPGLFIMLQRVRQQAAIIRVDGHDPRGFWRGSQVVGGKADPGFMRLFRAEEVQAVRSNEGFRCVLPGVIANF